MSPNSLNAATQCHRDVHILLFVNFLHIYTYSMALLYNLTISEPKKSLKLIINDKTWGKMNQTSLNDKIHQEPRARTGAEIQLICESNVILNYWKDNSGSL